MPARALCPVRPSALATLPLHCVILFVLAEPQPASSATLTWTGAVSQSAEVAGNWSPMQVPAAADDLVWGAAGAPFVQFGVAAVSSSRTWTFAGPTQVFTSRAHTVAQGVRLTGSGAFTVSTLDSIVVNGDIENEGFGLVTIQQGCPVVGVDSARFNVSSLLIQGLNSRLLARHVRIGGALSVGSGARLVASHSLTMPDGAQVVLGGASSSITAPALAVPAFAYVSLFEGRLQLAGELQLQGTMGTGGGALVEAAAVTLTDNGSLSGSGTLAAPLLMLGPGTSLTANLGTLTVGVATDPGGVGLDGILQVNSGSELECLSASPVTLPPLVNVNDGTLRAASGFVIGTDAYVTASGTIVGDLDVAGGELSVPSGFGGPSRRLTIEGNWSQGPAARRTVSLSESGGAWSADSVVVTGQAEPGGTLDVYYDEFAGPPAGPVPFLFYSSRPVPRVFDELLLNGVPVTDELQVVYHATHAELVFGGSVSVSDPGPPASLHLAGRSGIVPSLVLGLPAASEVRLEVFDVGGRAVARLHDGPLGAGTHRFDLAGSARGEALPSGVYFARAAVHAAGGPALRTAKVVVRR